MKTAKIGLGDGVTTETTDVFEVSEASTGGRNGIASVLYDVVRSLTRTQKAVLFMVLDVVLISAALAFSLYASPLPEDAPAVSVLMLFALPYAALLGAGVLFALRSPWIPLAAFDAKAIARVAATSVILVAGAVILAALSGFWPSVGTFALFGATVFLLITVSRLILLETVLAIYRRGPETCRVLIYGAGMTGIQLVQAFRTHREIDPVAFVDDNSALHGTTISGLPVYAPLKIAEIARERRIDRVLLAVPSLTPPKQARIARRLQREGLDVQALPSFSQLIGREALIEKLQPVDPQTFLGRAEVQAALNDGPDAYRGRSVLVSGAGGSIGSELCRQLIGYEVKRLVLLELSEFALFTVEQELRSLANETGVELVAVLGSVTDGRRVRRTLVENEVEVVLHAAAYKHVTLVQQNPLAGLTNNVLGTHAMAHAAIEAGVDRFILISSDKAVRPRGIMGASKRLAELVLQDLASRVPEGGGPVFAMVRFGNVLGSSGSVVPIFNDQIRRGGPVTVTHPRATRYFMTIPEASRLVLKAGGMAEGGEVFLLDMGEPVRILSLANQAIEAAGYTVRDDDNPEGDIAIEFIGLRDGEKLEEELFMDGSERPTAHRKIFRVREAALSEIEVADVIRSLRSSLASGDEGIALAMLRRRLETFRGEFEDGDVELSGAF
ncbi:MAG: nucleoside-diphosphate sugar epimerase/dehydratase [Pseudomonadota bacterium]